MRNSYYDFNGWGRDSGVVPQKWEPGKPIPFDQEPEKTGLPNRRPTGRAAPPMCGKSGSKSREIRRETAPGAFCFSWLFC